MMSKRSRLSAGSPERRPTKAVRRSDAAGPSPLADDSGGEGAGRDGREDGAAVLSPIDRAMNGHRFSTLRFPNTNSTSGYASICCLSILRSWRSPSPGSSPLTSKNATVRCLATSLSKLAMWPIGLPLRTTRDCREVCCSAQTAPPDLLYMCQLLYIYCHIRVYIDLVVP